MLKDYGSSNEVRIIAKNVLRDDKKPRVVAVYLWWFPDDDHGKRYVAIDALGAMQGTLLIAIDDLAWALQSLQADPSKAET